MHSTLKYLETPPPGVEGRRWQQCLETKGTLLSAHRGGQKEVNKTFVSNCSHGRRKRDAGHPHSGR